MKKNLNMNKHTPEQLERITKISELLQEAVENMPDDNPRKETMLDEITRATRAFNTLRTSKKDSCDEDDAVYCGLSREEVLKKVGITEADLDFGVALSKNASHKELKRLIENGANVNMVIHLPEKGVSHASPIHRAADDGDQDLVKFLLANGANINIKGGKNGATPLHEAVCNADIEMINLLIKKGADINATDKDGDTPFHYIFCIQSLKGKIIAEKLVNLLIEKNANPLALNKHEVSPLIMLAGLLNKFRSNQMISQLYRNILVRISIFISKSSLVPEEECYCDDHESDDD